MSEVREMTVKEMLGLLEWHEQMGRGDFVVQAGDLDVAGDWQLQAYVEFPTWKGRGEVATLKVKNTI